MHKVLFVLKREYHYYIDKQIPLAGAALCYYVTMTVFPLVICLYTLLGKNYDVAIGGLAFVESFLSEAMAQTVRSFLSYVADNHSPAMLYAGAAFLITSASTAIRSMLVTIGRMQGAHRYGGIWKILFSLLFSIVFLFATYFAIMAILSSRVLVEAVSRHLPFLGEVDSWYWIRYVLLSGILFLFFWGVFSVARSKNHSYRTWPGAILATVGNVGMSMVFSVFIAASARYSLVYGSLASVILLMVWLYFSCQIIYLGAAFNLSINDLKCQKEN